MRWVRGWGGGCRARRVARHEALVGSVGKPAGSCGPDASRMVSAGAGLAGQSGVGMEGTISTVAVQPGISRRAASQERSGASRTSARAR